MSMSVSPRADQGQKLMVSYREAGQMLGVCERTVFGLVKAGDLAKVSIGRSVRIPVSALQDFIDQQTTKASA
jgi:excisionase family DNA binding protein